MRHLGDWLRKTAHLTMQEDGCYMRLVDWCYTHERPLPFTEREVMRIARAATRHEREAVRRVLHAFFTLTEDGWHQSRIDRELVAFTRKVERETNHPHSARERSQRARDKRAETFKRAAAYGLSTRWNASTADLEQQIAEHLASGIELASRAVTTRDNESCRHVSDTATDIQNPLTSAVPSAAVTVAAAPDYAAAAKSAAAAEGVIDPTRIGQVVRQLKSAGLSGFNTAHPQFLRLVQQGVTDDEWRLTAAEAVTRDKAWGWLLATIAGRRADVAAGFAPPRAGKGPARPDHDRVAGLTPTIARKRQESA